MEIEAKFFRKVMGSFATGVTVVTTLDGEGSPYSVTVNSFTSLSLDPPLVLFCLANQMGGLPAFQEQRRFAINILSRDQQEISTHCATRDTDRSMYSTARGASGLPVVENPLALIECELRETFPGGDHTILIGEVIHLSVSPSIDDSPPLLFYRGRYAELA